MWFEEELDDEGLVQIDSKLLIENNKEKYKINDKERFKMKNTEKHITNNKENYKINRKTVKMILPSKFGLLMPRVRKKQKTCYINLLQSPTNKKQN